MSTPEEPAEPPSHSIFDPASRADPPEPPSNDPSSYEAPSFGSSFGSSFASSFGAAEEDPDPAGTTPRFGTDVPEPAPEPVPTESRSEPAFPSFGDSAFDTKPYESFAPSSPEPPEPPKAPQANEPAEPPGTEDVSPTPASYGSYGLPPAPKRRVTAEDEAAENDFFASDDHPPVWDKVVAPVGPPPKPGKPSSGNLRLPDWMREEQARAANPEGPAVRPPDYDDEEGHSRRPLFVGLGVLVAGILAVGGVYVLKHDGDSQASNASAPSKSTPAPSQAPKQPAGGQPVRKPLPRFKGVHTKALGRIDDPRSGLSYAHLAKPWAVPPAQSPMNELGFSASQFAVTQKAGAQPKAWARLMSAQLSGAAKQSYQGPDTARQTVTDLAQVYEARMYTFRHRKRHLASQPLDIGGHKGWLVSDYVTYHRRGLKASGDVVMVALVDTGKASPGVLFMSIPNSDRKLWPDVNFVVRSLRVTP